MDAFESKTYNRLDKYKILIERLGPKIQLAQSSIYELQCATA